MRFWYPLIRGIIPTPKTTIIDLEEGDLDLLFEMLDGKNFPEKLHSRIIKASKQYSFPLFFRTDFTSGKHSFVETCYVKEEGEFKSHIFALFEDTILKDINIGAFVIREYLPLVAPFEAFNHLPIAKERRYFVEDGIIICHHPYWPEEAIEFYRDTKKPKNWKEDLRMINYEHPSEIRFLSLLAKDFSIHVPGAWSVDFALPQDHDWIMIDAAEAHRSWHPSDCKIVFKEAT